jgi:PIN domain nuclease of toxin-antitoxin system
MNLLLDTCTLLWSAREPTRLPHRVRDLLLDSSVMLSVSVVSAWEISVKPSLGVKDSMRWCRTAAANLHAAILPVRLEHIGVLQRLPSLHKDPFDRMLIAQAVLANLKLVTGDEAIQRYSAVHTIWE